VESTVNDFDWRASRQQSLQFEVAARALDKTQINPARRCPMVRRNRIDKLSQIITLR
jgi:hypothetical protein